MQCQEKQALMSSHRTHVSMCTESGLTVHSQHSELLLKGLIIVYFKGEVTWKTIRINNSKCFLTSIYLSKELAFSGGDNNGNPHIPAMTSVF